MNIRLMLASAALALAFAGAAQAKADERKELKSCMRPTLNLIRLWSNKGSSSRTWPTK